MQSSPRTPRMPLVAKLVGCGALAAAFALVPASSQARSPAGLSASPSDTAQQLHAQTSAAYVQAQPARPERHPHMRTALRQLRGARKQLAESAHDYGGHRVTALGEVDQAIQEIEQGLAYDAQQEKGGTGKRAP